MSGGNEKTQAEHGNGNGRKKLNKKRLFIKTFFISIAIFAGIAGAGLFAAMKLAKPPALPSYADDPSPPELAYYPAESHDDDKNIGNGVFLPEGFTMSDRKKDFYTFLIIGLDEGIQTDTIIVASYDGVNGEAHLINVPRDSLVNVKRPTKKINAAYGAGTLDGGGREGGVSQLRRELKTIIGFAPDFYVIINLNAFVRIVDAVEGVEVNVPINMIYDDPDQNLHINISRGLQTLYGREALHFARYRQGNDRSMDISDYKRIENQQQVIKAVLNKLLRPANIVKIPEFIDIFNKNVFTNFKAEDILWFANEFKKIESADALTMHTLPTSGTVRFNLSYEILDEDGILELVNATVNPYKKNIEPKDLDIITKID